MNKTENNRPQKITESVLLDKAVDISIHLVEGSDIAALLNENISFYLEYSGADIIALYLNDDDMVQPEYIFEKNNLFDHLAKKYMLDKKKFTWKKFIENFTKYFSPKMEYNKITTFSKIFNGFMSTDEAEAFAEELQIKDMIFVPLYAKDEATIMGYISFIFHAHIDIDTIKLEQLSLMFQTVLRPLYHLESNTMYSKCIRVDGEMKILTEQEKKIVEKILGGYTYLEVAESLGVSVNTVKTHMKHVFNKCNVNSKMELFHKFSIYQ